MKFCSVEEISKIRKRSRKLKSAHFNAVSEGIQMAFMSPDTLDVTINLKELDSYVDATEQASDKKYRKINQIMSHFMFIRLCIAHY